MTLYDVLDRSGNVGGTADVDEAGGVVFVTTGSPAGESRFTSTADFLERVHAMGGTVPDLEVDP